MQSASRTVHARFVSPVSLFTAPSRRVLGLACALLSALLSGCTSRGMNVTSLPPGAEVSINRRVVGQTPIRVNYSYYGTYRLELRKERYEALVKNEKISPPIYGYDPLTFVADNVIPARFNDEIYLHYVLTPVRESDRTSLLERANLAREGKVTNPRTNEALEVAMPLPAKGGARAGAGTAAQPAAPEVAGPAPVPQLELPKTPRAVEGAPERPPQGPSIVAPEAPPALETPPAGEAPKPPAEATPVPATPATPAPPKSERPTRMRRTPKGEILIYEEELHEDPEKKKK